jgi:hypothetical protein
MNLYVSIAMDVKKPTTITIPICEYCNWCKTKKVIITRPICKYSNLCLKNQQLL